MSLKGCKSLWVAAVRNRSSSASQVVRVRTRRRKSWNAGVWGRVDERAAGRTKPIGVGSESDSEEGEEAAGGKA